MARLGAYDQASAAATAAAAATSAALGRAAPNAWLVLGTVAKVDASPMDRDRSARTPCPSVAAEVLPAVVNLAPACPVRAGLRGTALGLIHAIINSSKLTSRAGCRGSRGRGPRHPGDGRSGAALSPRWPASRARRCRRR